MDVAQVLKQVRKHITDQGMVARGADKTDFQFADTRDLYFRTGSSHEEVTIIPVVFERAHPPVRITNEDQVDNAKYIIDSVIHSYRTGDFTRENQARHPDEPPAPDLDALGRSGGMAGL